MITRKPCSLILILFLFIAACSRKSGLPESMKAFHVEYEIDYLEKYAGDIPTRVLPRTMESYYAKHFVHTEIEGFLNQFSLVQIADLRQRRVTTLLTFFGTKVCYTGEPGMLPASIMDLPDLEYRYTGERKMIGQLLSEKVEISTGNESYEIYFTKEIPTRRPNISTPYREIDHPLTDFRIQLSHLRMHLRCTGIRTEQVDSELFMIPEEFKHVNRSAMEEIINSLFTND